MNTKIVLLPHHFTNVICRYHFSEGWQERLELVKQQHGAGMVAHLNEVLNSFFNSPTEIRFTIFPPDSVCNPKLSSICRECTDSFYLGGYPSSADKKDYEEYKLRRIRADKEYRKMRQIMSALDEVTHLLYYSLEPKEYPSEFLIERLEETGKKTRRTSMTHLPWGYIHSPNLVQNFPDVAKFMASGLYESFIERSIIEHLEKKRITSQEINSTKQKYPSLFSSLCSDEFYYKVLDIIQNSK